MLPTLTPYQKRKHREALDEIYLEKQLVFLTQQKSEILFAIREYRKKHFTSYHNHFVSIDIASRLLNTSKRTLSTNTFQASFSALIRFSISPKSVILSNHYSTNF